VLPLESRRGQFLPGQNSEPRFHFANVHHLSTAVPVDARLGFWDFGSSREQSEGPHFFPYLPTYISALSGATGKGRYFRKSVLYESINKEPPRFRGG
jgi:hypothetical protein